MSKFELIFKKIKIEKKKKKKDQNSKIINHRCQTVKAFIDMQKKVFDIDYCSLFTLSNGACIQFNFTN